MNDQRPILDEVGGELNRLFVAAEARGSRLGRLRSRSWMRARVLLPLATLVVAGSAAAATLSLTGGAKPLTGGGYFACPPGDNYMADHQNGVVYPANYPTYKGTNLGSAAGL